MADLSSIKKGDKVFLRLFTGAFVETKVVEKADLKKVGFTNKKGIEMVFNKATGKQVSPAPKSERFASYIEPYDAKVEKAELAKKNSRKPSKKKSAEEE